LSTLLPIAVLGLAYATLFALERARPLRRVKRRLIPRLIVNVVVSTTTFAAAAVVVQPTAAAMLDLTRANAFGLIPLLGLTGIFGMAATFLLLDLSFYYWHVANHRVALLWRFHNVHHIDPDLDVSTAFRFHFVEPGNAISPATRLLARTRRTTPATGAGIVRRGRATRLIGGMPPALRLPHCSDRYAALANCDIGIRSADI